jgi:cysteine-rich repeat protein
MRRWLLLIALPGCIDWSSLYESRCGDGRVEGAEECDDGNSNDSDACLSTCKWATCGDGHVRAGVEECDDGNQVDGDGCSSRCLRCDDGDGNFVFSENGHCYTRHDAMLNWNDAEATCNAAHAYLATFVSNHENLAVATALLNTAPSTTWIGMRDRNDTGYAWITAEPLAQFTDWAGGKPSMGGACAVEQATNGQPQPSIDWATVACDRQLGFVCEKAPPEIRPEDHHAYVPLFLRTSWYDARDACAKSGGHLITIHDSAENAFAAALSAGEFWIGAFDPNGPGPEPPDASCPTDAGLPNYQWVTGGSVSSTFFAPGEPDHADCAGCLLMGVDEGWHDRPCDTAGYYAPYICEIE